MTAANTAFLIVSFLYPDSATPLLTLITIVSSITWIFQSNAQFKGSEKKINRYILLAALNSLLCIVLGFTGTINNKTNPNCYVYQFNEDVAFLGGISFNYVGLIAIILILPIILIFSELIVSAEHEKKCTDNPKEQEDNK